MAATDGHNNGTSGTNGHTNGHTNGANGHYASPICSIEEFAKTEFDYLICGGGTAGLTVAARLTENQDITVGVIEAGKYRIGDPNVDIPAMFMQMLGNPEYDWMIKTEPQIANHNKVHHMPRGKVLGGSSGINYMMYVRGSDADYNDWAKLVKDDSWDSENIKQYMRKHQTLEPIDDAVTDRSTMPLVGEFHGTSGPVRTSFNDSKLPIEDAIIQACDEASGYAKKPNDPWSGDHIGFFNTLGAVIRTGPNKGKRSYAARGYFEANKERPNLKVLCEALVNKVNLDGAKATGVNFNYGGCSYDVNVRNEVIVSGGTINSPQLLELSGIGNFEILRAAGVECKIDLPQVGENFQDHVVVGAGFEVAEGIFTLDGLYKPEMMEAAQKALVEKQGGPLTCISSCQGFFPYNLVATPEELKETIKSIRDTQSKSTSKFEREQLDQIIAHLQDDKSANLQLVIIPATGNLHEGAENQAVLFPPPSDDGKPYGVTFAMCLQYPVSRGSIHIQSSDPSVQPKVQPNYLNHPADRTVLAAGLKFIDNVSKSSAVKGKLTKRYHPAPHLDLQNQKDGIEGVQDWCMGEYHPCGSVAMGDVLDSHLRVKGVQGLRVVDASVFPNNVSGNIVSSVYAVAEKAADIIKADNDFGALKGLKS